MLFHDIKLPKFIEVFASGKPEFKVSTATTISGREMRSLVRDESMQKYEIKNCILSKEQFTEFNSFFRARKGTYYAFRFRDYADFQVSKQVLMVADYAQDKTKIPLYKIYDDPILPYIRRVTKPVRGEVKLYLNNIDFETEIDYDSGLINLPRPLREGEILSADFIFDVPVRFTNESFEYKLREDGSIEITDLELLEVVE